jgi:hypothetical protein
MEQFEEEFSKPPTDLAGSIIKQGYSVLHGDASELEKYETSNLKLGEGKLGEAN